MIQDSGSASEKRWNTSRAVVWRAVPQRLHEHGIDSIDDIIAVLVENKLVRAETPTEWVLVKQLVFAIIGLQTMLYRSDIHSHPPDQLSIANEMEWHAGQAHMQLVQPESASRMRLNQFLVGFGVLLPPREFKASNSVDDEAAFRKSKNLSPESFNAHYLCSVAGIVIKCGWTTWHVTWSMIHIPILCFCFDIRRSAWRMLNATRVRCMLAQLRHWG